MAYTAQDLITRSLYLSGILARNLQTPTFDQINNGLQMLNSMLDFKQIELDLIPYYTYIEMPLIAGQENYFLPFVGLVESATFNINVVRYPMDSVSRRNYYGSARVDNISSLPFSWNYNRALGGGYFATYFLPESNYPLKMMVKIFLVDVALNTDLTNISVTGLPYTFINSANQGLDTSYIEYLRYELAAYFCSEYGIQFNPDSMNILKSYKRKLMYIEPPDLSMKKVSILAGDGQQGYNYGDVNIGKGWRP
jgi:hypothetical protein